VAKEDEEEKEAEEEGVAKATVRIESAGVIEKAAAYSETGAGSNMEQQKDRGTRAQGLEEGTGEASASALQKATAGLATGAGSHTRSTKEAQVVTQRRRRQQRRQRQPHSKE
jgi:hypothetical protein